MVRTVRVPAFTLLVASLVCMVVAVVLSPAVVEAQCPPGGLYAPTVHYTTGPNPHDVLPGDFDEDGILDLAVASSGTNQVAILRGFGSGGVGNGAFAAPVFFSAGPAPFCLASGDFNEDGVIDLVAGNNGASSVTILLGLGAGGVGNGAFAPPRPFATGASPFRITTGDFNEDGIMDLAVANNASADVSVLLGLGAAGTGNGTFGAPTNYPTGSYPSGVTTGDFDEDGILDLAVSNFGPDNVAVLRGRGTGGVGDGTFDPAVFHAAGSNTFCVVSGDVNEDGILDLVTANALANTVSVLLGLGSGGVGNGSFAPAASYATAISPGVVVLADIDLDGITDIAVMNAISNDVSILLGHGSAGVGDGTFGLVANFPVGPYAISLAGGDFDGDGRIDFVTADYDGGGISVLLSGCVPRAPVLTDVRDVPRDNGGRVFVTWLASILDTPGQRTITGYRIWRRIAPNASSASASVSRPGSERWRVRSIPRSDGGLDVTYWEALATLPAEQLEGYGFTAPTTEDSTRLGLRYTAFFVTALTADPFVFYESNIDSGYSVDNLPPRRPVNLSAAREAGGVALLWDENPETDLDSYRIYRGTTPDFIAGEDRLIGIATDPAFLDESGRTGDHYQISAVDRHGNEGPTAWVPGPGTLAGENPGPLLSLSGAWPNPASRDLDVVFTLPDAARATLELLDLGGRRVAAREVGSLGAGHHVFPLGAGLTLRAGVYLVRLGRADRVLSAKVAVVP